MKCKLGGGGLGLEEVGEDGCRREKEKKGKRNKGSKTHFPGGFRTDRGKINLMRHGGGFSKNRLYSINSEVQLAGGTLRQTQNKVNGLDIKML